MTQFNDREKAFENKFAKDEEFEFKVAMRRNKLLGLWAAEKMGLSGADAQNYAKEVVQADFEETGHEDVYRKIKTDFEAKGVEISEHRLRKAMDEFLEEARLQLKAEGKS
ncbi:DUF1476 domain-containing protein [Luteithermobacter gelatinilyticus]|uniref:DUF1476 domain-containing protein n=1 Tax=Luteithermobacter gelatinilyticus TaxID=2582913 RepID=UPI001106B86E|nr:DUF1476 domain-containing protein [Luteithermobacter gelatinilyticus]|tara:strand:+ start:60392 stop:60721 length:330 start_codon:yes stop_codon:yes gene_type:complete